MEKSQKGGGHIGGSFQNALILDMKSLQCSFPTVSHILILLYQCVRGVIMPLGELCIPGLCLWNSSRAPWQRHSCALRTRTPDSMGEEHPAPAMQLCFGAKFDGTGMVTGACLADLLSEPFA